MSVPQTSGQLTDHGVQGLDVLKLAVVGAALRRSSRTHKALTLPAGAVRFAELNQPSQAALCKTSKAVGMLPEVYMFVLGCLTVCDEQEWGT